MEISEQQFSQIITGLATLEEGLKGIHRRQDITNGRIAKNEEKVAEIDKKLVGVDASIGELKDRNVREDERDGKAEANRTYWTRQFMERILWIVLILSGVVLTKLGIINLSI